MKKIRVKWMDARHGDKMLEMTAKELKAVLKTGEMIVNEKTKKVIHADKLEEKVENGEMDEVAVIPQPVGG